MRNAINFLILAFVIVAAATSQTAIQPNIQFIPVSTAACPQPFLTLISNETPGAVATCSGTDPQHCPPDGTTRAFAIAGQPWGGSVVVYKNKNLLLQGTDFQLNQASSTIRPSGSQIVFATAPVVGDAILATYMVLVNTQP